MKNMQPITFISGEYFTSPQGRVYYRAVTSLGKFNLFDKPLIDKAIANMGIPVMAEIMPPNQRGFMNIKSIETNADHQAMLNAITEPIGPQIATISKDTMFKVSYAKDLFICMYSAQQVRLGNVDEGIGKDMAETSDAYSANYLMDLACALITRAENNFNKELLK